jgi:Spy/CpxP family protein refolding chaperone
MLMKKMTTSLLAGILALGTCSLATAHETSSAPNSKPNTIPYNLHDEDDKTDVLAIPSDSTEQEQEDEMDDLHKSEQHNKSNPK